LRGDAVFSGNGIGTRVGYIKFQTNRGQTFEIGNNNRDKYPQYVDGAFLTGIFGRANVDLDTIGFVVTQTIDRTALENVRYPDLASLTTGLTPQDLYSQTYINSGPTENSFSRSISETTGEDNCWEVSLGLTFGMEVSVTAGVPAIASTTAGYHWEVSATASHTRCKSTARTESRDFYFYIPPFHTCYIYIFQWVSRLYSIRYTGDFVFYMQNGYRIGTSVSGYYDGLYVSETFVNNTCIELLSLAGDQFERSAIEKEEL